ncbi:cytochrome-c peroxidase [Dongia sp.]|uniref:cytochrome-c peroxidase n=1 Tax=Dongia sp. TaxID=1977262 RepID=UPI00375154FE
MNCNRLLLAVTTVLSLVGPALSAGADGTAAAPTQTASTAQPPADVAALKALYARPTEIPFPKTNPYTPEKAELGKTLFFDPRLSRVAVEACVSCHNPSFGWEDGRKTAVGDNMVALRRNSPSILNRAWGQAFFWDGRADSLEAQATGPITSTAEMNMPMEVLLDRLKAIPGYQQRFDVVFPGQGITAENIAKAIATFERTIVSGVAPFDRWIAGDEAAISDQAKHGFVVFNTTGQCTACHSGWTFTDDSFHDIGLPATTDLGRAEIVTGVAELERSFKTPGLRNIDQRAPYMHDGSVATLEDVLKHYVNGIVSRPSLSSAIKPVPLSDQDVGDVVAFLKTLTSEDRPMTMPVLP